MPPQSVLAQLIDALHAGEISLADLVGRLNQRGPVGAAQHAQELRLLDEALQNGKLEPAVHRAIVAKLRGAQPDAAAQRHIETVIGLKVPELPADDVPTQITGQRPGDDALTQITAERPVSAEDLTAASGRPPSAGEDSPTVIGLPADDAETQAATAVRDPAREPGDTVLTTGNSMPSMPSMTGQSGPTGDTGAGSGPISQSSWERFAMQSQAHAQAASQVRAGHLLKGRFHLDREIGRGGMGVVFKARDERKVEAHDRNPWVAIKILNDDFKKHPQSLIALQRESRRAQQLAHDNIVRVFDFDKDGATVYMTMEFIDGRTLKELIREKGFDGLSLEQARPIIEGMSRGLGRAHRDGVVHSDFKPGNVLLTKDNIPKIFDFGIARAGKGHGGAHGETTQFDASTLGALTPAYASLEMLRGEAPEIRDDIYALSIVVYELLTGKHPFEKKNAEVAQKEGLLPTRVKGLTRTQWRTLQQGLAFRREDRLPTAEALIDGMRPRSLRELAVPAGVAAMAALVLIVIAIGPLRSYFREQRTAEVTAHFQESTYPDVETAVAELESLAPEQRETVLGRASAAIQDFFFRRANDHWDAAKSRYDFPQARAILATVDRLYNQDSRRVSEYIARVEAEKNQALNRLNDEFNERLAAGRIFEDQEGNVLGTLDVVRRIDPRHPLLGDQRLLLAYTADVRQLLDDGKLDAAQARLATGLKVFPAATELATLDADLRASQEAQLAMVREQELEAQGEQRAAAAKQEAQQALAALLAAPADTPDWRTQVRGAYDRAKGLLPADDPWLRQRSGELAGAFAGQADTLQERGDLDAALEVAGLGLELFPSDRNLARQRQDVLKQRDRQQKEAASQAERIAQAVARVDTVLGKASAAVGAAWAQDAEFALAQMETLVGAQDSRYAEKRGTFLKRLDELSRQKLTAGDFEGAELLARRGLQLEPASAALQGQLRSIEQGRQQQKQRELAQAEQQLAATRTNLAELAGRARFTPEWETAVDRALADLAGDTSAQTLDARSKLELAYAAQAVSDLEQKRYAAAQRVIERGLKRFPGAPRLQQEKARIETARQAYEKEQATLVAAAEVEGIKQTLLTRAAANDIRMAERSFTDLRGRLPASDAFMADAAPRAIGQAYLRQAERLASQGKFGDARRLAGTGARMAPMLSELATAEKRYRLEGSVAELRAAAADPASIDGDALAEAARYVKAEDPKRYAELEAEVTRALAGRVETLVGTDRERARTVLSEARKALPDSDRLAKLTVPSEAAARSASDPCKAEFATYGASNRATCSDVISAGGQAPRLVVVPGSSGGAAFAITKYEVTVRQFNDFCRATGQCSPVSASSDQLPVTGISFQQAKAYAAWLSQATGFTYRVPTEDEWLHAATAQGRGAGDDFNCVLLQGAQQIKGGAPIAVTTGRPNPWGLINVVGNAAEWVDAPDGAAYRGGSYEEAMSRCSPELRNRTGGQSEKTVGLRLVRELGSANDKS